MWRANRASGFSLVELVVVAALVAGLLLIAGQLFVELIRRQELLGQALTNTRGLAPVDSFVVRDAREGRPQPALDTLEAGPRVLILRMPPDEEGVQPIVVWQADGTGGLTRTVHLDDKVVSTMSYQAAGVASFRQPLGSDRPQIIFQVHDGESATPILVRVVTHRNL